MVNCKSPLLELIELSITYPHTKQPIINSFSLKINRANIIGIIGDNGSGKTTLLKTIARLIPIYNGKIIYHTNKIGYVPENCMLCPYATAYDILYYNLKLAQIEHNIENRIDALLEQFNLTNYKHQKIATFSKGMRQRVAFAQAIAHDPELILLDEPYSGLDKTSKEIINNLIIEQNNRGCSFLISAHEIATNNFHYLIDLNKNDKLKQ
ncbi:MAG: ABC transporter ATP-binding protein [Candidatus Babeliales bacterium]